MKVARMPPVPETDEHRASQQCAIKSLLTRRQGAVRGLVRVTRKKCFGRVVPKTGLTMRGFLFHDNPRRKMDYSPDATLRQENYSCNLRES